MTDTDVPGDRGPVVLARPDGTTTVTCPICGQTGPVLVQRGAVALCRTCAGSVVLDADGASRRATITDVMALSAPDRADLQKVRGGMLRTKR